MQPTEQIPTLLVNNQKLKDSKTVANAAAAAAAAAAFFFFFFF
jgi:hypothetical protein